MKAQKTGARRPRRQQREVVSSEIVDTLLGFIRSHWYREAPAEAFAKDRPRLLDWVIFEAAADLDEKSVTLPGARYLEIHMTILREALTHGSRATYPPAYLRHVVQSHWRIHGETYYDEAKRVTPRIEDLLRDAAGAVARRPDPIRDLAAAQKLLQTQRRTARQRAKDLASAESRQLGLF